MVSGSRHPNWQIAESLLSAVLPGSESFEPDQIATLSPSSWQDFDVDGREPSDIDRDIFNRLSKSPTSLLVVVTFASYQADRGPFFVRTDSLPQLMRTHSDVFDDSFASADVVAVAAATGKVLVVHHTGLIAELHGQALSLDHLFI